MEYPLPVPPIEEQQKIVSKIERLFKMTRFNTEEAFVVFSNKLRKMGLDDELIKMNIKEGDTIRILDYEFEYRK